MGKKSYCAQILLNKCTILKETCKVSIGIVQDV